MFVQLGYIDTEQRLIVRSPEIPMLHSCTESNTFIIDFMQLEEEQYYDMRADLLTLDGLIVPYGQFAFFTYTSDGEFFSWSTSDSANSGKIIQAFKSFGFTPTLITPSTIQVSDRDLFKLRLRFGS